MMRSMTSALRGECRNSWRCGVENEARSEGSAGAAQERRAWAEPLLAGVVVSLIAEAKEAGWSGRLEYVVEMCVQEMTSTLGMSHNEIVDVLMRWAGELGEELSRDDVQKAIEA